MEPTQCPTHVSHISLMVRITIVIDYFLISHPQNALCEIHIWGHFITESFASNKITVGRVLGKLSSGVLWWN